jgi:hypothetical protein
VVGRDPKRSCLLPFVGPAPVTYSTLLPALFFSWYAFDVVSLLHGIVCACVCMLVFMGRVWHGLAGLQLALGACVRPPRGAAGAWVLCPSADLSGWLPHPHLRAANGGFPRPCSHACGFGGPCGSCGYVGVWPAFAPAPAHTPLSRPPSMFMVWLCVCVCVSGALRLPWAVGPCSF